MNGQTREVIEKSQLLHIFSNIQNLYLNCMCTYDMKKRDYVGSKQDQKGDEGQNNG